MAFEENRKRRARRSKNHIRALQSKDSDLIRLVVFRSNQHIYGQALQYDPATRQTVVMASASTLEKAIRTEVEAKTSNIGAAQKVGQALAQRLLEKNIKQVAFDRSGYKYHGRVKALADAAREAGLDF
ncbi:MAG: rplR [Gammaproteobacteria bacterium]|jgi:large subunit ribosomal protein L18|nr:rplR [Gammaproteobacteria bacterium]